MRKGSDLIGKPVVTFDTGERVERIQDLLFDQANNLLLGFVVDEGGWFSGARVLPINHIQALGPDTVIIPDRRAITPADTNPMIRQILERNNVLKGTRIVTTDGKDLGTLVDLYFDEHTGVIEGYEVSGGLFADAAGGRSFVPAPQTLKIGEDVAFVPPETVQLMEEQANSLQGASYAGASTSTAATSLGVEQTMGRRVNQVVRTEHGLIIAAPGQIVTEQVVNRARTYQKEEELIEAVGLSTTNAVYNTEGSTTPSIGASEVAAGATNLWDRLKSKVSESQQATAMEAEERRIKYAVGRPVTRVILDPQDNVILNVGEIITFHAVELSRAAGVLDMLLSSVYDKDPELSPEELRAPEPGQAAMEQQDKEVGA